MLDLDLPDRPPLAETDDYDAALRLLTGVQEAFYDGAVVVWPAPPC